MRLFTRLTALKNDSRVVVRQIAAWCLHYPDDVMRDQLDLLMRAAGEMRESEPVRQLRDVLRYVASTPAREAEQHYIEVFDTSPRRGLHLTWYVDGDTRRRGATLAELAGLYQKYGFRAGDGELPDYLPALLEFSAQAPASGRCEVEETVVRFRPALVMLHRNLNKLGTIYACAVSAVLATVSSSDLPVTDPPPAEQVGLEPFAVAPEGIR